MTQSQGPYIRIMTRPQGGLLERIVFFALGIVVLVAAFFFIGIALIAGAVLACVFLIRLWWLRRKLQRAAQDSYVEGEYTVIENTITDQRVADEHRADQQTQSAENYK
jgi:ABC-type bacteriocin/lantibiotic exporter with double-glycine peptidase domain